MGLITEVHGADGAPPYVVRWLANGHVATVFPGSDAIVVTAAEQEQGRRAGTSAGRRGAVRTELTLAASRLTRSGVYTGATNSEV